MNFDFWENKNIFVTGSCGSIGKEILEKLRVLPVKRIVGVDNNESQLFFLRESFLDDPRFCFSLSDVRNRDEIFFRMSGVDYVIHSAAFKHVQLCEESPRETIQTNIVGLQNIIDAAITNKVKNVLFTSSDKAVNPTNVMGTSKLMGEKMISAAQGLTEKNGTKFSSTRFGNVLGSSGSVIPLFRKQILSGGPVTLTHQDMSRFIMTLDQATELVLNSIELMCGGEVFVTKMPVVKISDLAKAMIDLFQEEYQISKLIDIKVIGVKPGEKMYEELINTEELRRTKELENFFVILPAFQSSRFQNSHVYPKEKKYPINEPYNSSEIQSLTISQIKDLLKIDGIFESGISL